MQEVWAEGSKGLFSSLRVRLEYQPQFAIATRSHRD